MKANGFIIYFEHWMKIRISMKDCDSNCQQQAHYQSEAERKKNLMLYAPPERDTNKQTRKNQREDSKNERKGTMKETNAYRESERQMLDALNKNAKKQSNQGANNITNNTLQKQNEIIEQNQQILNKVVRKNEKEGEQELRKELRDAINQVGKDVQQIKKIRDDLMSAAKEFRNQGESRPQQQHPPQQQMFEMNSNLKNLVQVSQNHLEGLENMEGIKALQNFNIEGYTSAINNLKRQIAQYQKQSQNIERQLKIRSAKLEKIQISPQFEEELYKPYENHINNRIKAIDLHSIRERVYEKLGTFDYGKFEYDLGNITNEVKDELNNFTIICKEHKIQVPQIKFDPKQLKKMDIKIPSVLDEYKAARGIIFEQKKENIEKNSNQNAATNSSKKQSKMNRTNQINQIMNNTAANSAGNKRIQPRTKPIDLAHQARLTREADKKKTILEDENKQEKKKLEERMKKSEKQKKKEDEDFEKYLENRAREELEMIYKEKKERLQRMQNQLHEECSAPTFIELNMDSRRITKPENKETQPKKEEKHQQVEEEYADEFEDEESQSQREKEKKRRSEERSIEKGEENEIKKVGKDILKEKLKQMIAGKKPATRTDANNDNQRGRRSSSNDGRQVQNFAQGFINMINHTLTQVNSNLAQAIERKVDHSREKSPRKFEKRQRQQGIEIPKLEPFKAPPTFNVNSVPQFYPQPMYVPQQASEAPAKKIVVQNYEEYIPKEDDKFDDLNISEDDSEFN